MTKMIIFTMFILVLSTYEIRQIKKNKNKIDIGVYIGLAIIAISLGLGYISNLFDKSITYQFLNLFGIRY